MLYFGSKINEPFHLENPSNLMHFQGKKVFRNKSEKLVFSEIAIMVIVY